MTTKMQAEVEINKPIQQVWDYVNNPENLQKWITDLEKYEHLTGDINNPKPGDTSRHTYNENGRITVMDEEIISFQPPHSVELFLKSSMFDMKIINKLTKLDENRSNYFSSAEFVRTGLLMKIALFFSPKSKLQGSHESQLGILKQLIEAN